MKKEVMIVTGEASGDLHGANLVRAMLGQDDGLLFCGMGGDELAACGMEILCDAKKVAVVGITEVLAHLGDIMRSRKVLVDRLRHRPPDLLILIDLPDFNLPLARKAKQYGIPVFYYITPQVWAWRSGRVKTIGERADKVGVILPFEEDFFRQRGVDAHYVGHPLLDSVRVSTTPAEFCLAHGIPPSARRVCLLPGSRKSEIGFLLPKFIEAARMLQHGSREEMVFLLPLASTLSEKDLLEAGLAGASDVDLRIVQGQRYEVMAACEAAIAASGTVTLELALLDIPMVVSYRLSPLTYHLGRMLVKLDHFSLVNLIAGTGVVPELLQDQVSPENICRHVRMMLDGGDYRQTILQGLAKVRQSLGGQGASERAARLALQMLQ
ncbi:MAG: lipid-A-disaccharide synthase [Desulfobulbaceae bacterium]|nr:MAG: lipid-A-disaccharide synthase [Desulfobulbaceae bacterium]